MAQLFSLGQEATRHPQLDDVPDIIHDDERPRRERRLHKARLIFPFERHPPFHDLSPVLREVAGEQESSGDPSQAGKEADTRRPDQAVD